MSNSTNQTPLHLKEYVRQIGGQGVFLQKMQKKGAKCSRTQINLTCNHGKLPKKTEREYKTIINQVLEEHGFNSKIAWLPIKKADSNQPTKANTVSSQSSEKLTQQGDHNMMNRTKEYLEPEHLRHFNLSEDPFFDSGNSRSIWLNGALEQIKHLVKVTAKHQGIMVITGDYGAGKSTLLRHVLGELMNEGKAQIIMPDRLDRQAMKGDMLTLAVISQMGGNMHIPRSVIQRDQLVKSLLTKAVEQGECPLLVIDEAHDLKSELFISLKRLWDSGLIFRNIGILLVGAGGKNKEGQSWGLRWEIEGNPDLREFAERTRLVDLSVAVNELADYLAWRFEKVGAELSSCFKQEAVTLLCERAGTPQLLSIMATKAMQEAYLDGSLQVNTDQVLRV